MPEFSLPINHGAPVGGRRYTLIGAGPQLRDSDGSTIAVSSGPNDGLTGGSVTVVVPGLHAALNHPGTTGVRLEVEARSDATSPRSFDLTLGPLVLPTPALPEGSGTYSYAVAIARQAWPLPSESDYTLQIGVGGSAIDPQTPPAYFDRITVYITRADFAGGQPIILGSTRGKAGGGRHQDRVAYNQGR